MTFGDLITNALLELGAYQPGDTPVSTELAFGLTKVNSLLDRWNAEGRALFATQAVAYSWTASQQSRTLGPTGNFVVTLRPVAIARANYIFGSPNIRLPIRIRDEAWWANVRIRAVASGVPTDLYYSADWPNGTIYLWPLVNATTTVELWTVTQLAQGSSTSTTFTLPAGYQDALTLSLAEELQGPFNRYLADLPERARRARAAAFGPNNRANRIRTADHGMPDSGRKGGFNYSTGDIA